MSNLHYIQTAIINTFLTFSLSATLFQLKDKSSHPSCRIYDENCSCGESYVGKTMRNVQTRWCEHNAPCDKSNPSKNFNENIKHIFSWKVISNALKWKLPHTTLEAYFIPTRLSLIYYFFLEMELHNFYYTINISNETIIFICI